MLCHEEDSLWGEMALLESAEELAEMSCCFRAAPASKDLDRSDWKRGEERHCLLPSVSKQILHVVGNMVWRVQ